MDGLSRRNLLVMAGAVAGASLVAVSGGTPALAQAPAASHWNGANSQNGWPVLNAAHVESVVVEGSDVKVGLLPGAVSALLLHVLRRYHYEVETLAGGDVASYTTDRTVGAPLESNYLSGTAVAIRPSAYPVHSTGNFFSAQVLVIRDILADCAGVVRWGGDDPTAPKEGHFQIDVPPGDRRLAAAVAQLSGVGAPPDVWTAERRNRAQALARQQHR